ncbi:MAG: rhodanese-like domain-containing protein [Lactobacillus sp.]|nr:rhodanese-like domain-containing protein [Lactobacillus sp.]
MQTFILVLDGILLVILIGFLAVGIMNFIANKRLGGQLTKEEFKEGMRKAQIVDLREAAPFKRKHIDGARSFPMSMFKYKYQELRKDMPVYLYSDSKTVTLKAARMLKRKGYNSIYYLTGGINDWDGRVKSSKY